MITRIGTIFLGLLATGYAGLWLIGWSLARPVQMRVGSPPTELGAQAVEFETESGVKVKGWWAAEPNSLGTIILLPGIRANRLSMVSRAKFLRSAGYSVLLIDLEGTGESKGDHITFGWNESRDVIAAVGFAHKIEPANRVAIIGSSLGGAAALLCVPRLNVDAMVLEAVYPTIETATRNRLTKYLGPPGQLAAPLLLMQLRSQLGVSADQLRPLDHAGALRCPVLIIGGQNDRNTTVQDTMAIYQAASGQKELWLVPHAGHVDLHQASPHEYERRVLAFLQRNLMH